MYALRWVENVGQVSLCFSLPSVPLPGYIPVLRSCIRQKLFIEIVDLAIKLNMVLPPWHEVTTSSCLTHWKFSWFVIYELLFVFSFWLLPWQIYTNMDFLYAGLVSVISPVSHGIYLASLASLLLFLGAWRLLRFWIIPWLYPDDPEEFPYWVPFIGKLWFPQCKHWWRIISGNCVSRI